jgi:hypothetical protein
VAPRGETQWVRNLRVASVAELRVGHRHEQSRVTEISDEELRRRVPDYPVFRII